MWAAYYPGQVSCHVTPNLDVWWEHASVIFTHSLPKVKCILIHSHCDTQSIPNIVCVLCCILYGTTRVVLCTYEGNGQQERMGMKRQISQNFLSLCDSLIAWGFLNWSSVSETFPTERSPAGIALGTLTWVACCSDSLWPSGHHWQWKAGSLWAKGCVANWPLIRFTIQLVCMPLLGWVDCVYGVIVEVHFRIFCC